MNSIDMLYEDYCVLTFRYSDGSEVQCVSTLNLSILKSLGIDYIDGIVDLLSYKIIPNDLFLNIYELKIEKGKELSLSPLDEFFQKSIKRRWYNV